jgi:hypothetical protein
MKKLALCVAVALVAVGFTNTVSPVGIKGGGASLPATITSAPVHVSSVPVLRSRAAQLARMPVRSVAALEALVSGSESAFLLFLGTGLIFAGVLLRRRIHAGRTPLSRPQAR